MQVYKDELYIADSGFNGRLAVFSLSGANPHKYPHTSSLTARMMHCSNTRAISPRSNSVHLVTQRYLAQFCLGEYLRSIGNKKISKTNRGGPGKGQYKRRLPACTRPGHFDKPLGVAFGGGRMLVADHDNKRLQVKPVTHARSNLIMIVAAVASL